MKQILLGRPLPTSAGQHERPGRPAVIAAFGLDALSSIAHAPQEILFVLVLAGAAGMALTLPIAAAVVLLLVIVALSYRQTIFAYPNGGGSYVVARQNLGTPFDLAAAAALMIDHLLVVAVSVTAGVQELTSAFPALHDWRVALCVACIALMTLANLRGIRESGTLFAVPTYAFAATLGVLVVGGLVRWLAGTLPSAVAAAPAPVERLDLFLVLRAFAGGCTALTGVEAIANGVPTFRPPEARNAAATLVTLAVVLGLLFGGVAFLAGRIGAVPTEANSVISQVGEAVGGRGPLYFAVQLATTVILVLAANTSFNGFPFLAAIMARDGYMPRQFANLGDRLAYSNGIIILGLVAMGLVVAFQGSTHALIPLFAVGVFVCFTLSQAGLHPGNATLVYDCTDPPGTVLGQSPPAGQVVPLGSAVSISVSSLTDGRGRRCQLNQCFILVWLRVGWTIRYGSAGLSMTRAAEEQPNVILSSRSDRAGGGRAPRAGAPRRGPHRLPEAAYRATIILRAAAGRTDARIAAELGLAERTVWEWPPPLRPRAAGRAAGPAQCPPPRRYTADVQARLLVLACQRPAEADPTRAGQTHWTVQDLAAYVGAHPELGLGAPSRSTVGVVLKRL